MQDQFRNDEVSIQEDKTNSQKELSIANSSASEEYVVQRIKDSLKRVYDHALKSVEKNTVLSDFTEHLQNLMQDAITAELHFQQSLPNAILSPFPMNQSTGPLYMLKFTHKCLAIGCTNTACDLCESNPRRGCISDFGNKYFKGDILKAKCGGSIFIELVNMETEERILANQVAPDSTLELCIVNGNRFDQLFPQGCNSSVLTPELESCMLLQVSGDRPLLRCEDKALNRENGMVVMSLKSAQNALCDLTVHCSSEALLSGRRPPFRLLARLSSPSQPNLASKISPAMSSSFVVASGRSRLSQKKTVPFLDDPVSRLENMGKERIKKLKNLLEAAKSMNVDLPSLSCWEIVTVSDFQKLAFEVDTDGQVKQKLLHMLKMSEKAWEESRDHAASAITNDTRMRAWYKPNSAEKQGLAYVCYLGEMEMERPVALMLGNSVILKECLDPHQRTLMKELQGQALECWWKPNHPNWTFFDFDSEVYKKDHKALLSYNQCNRKSLVVDKDFTSITSGAKKQAPDTRPVDDDSGLDIQVSSCHSSASHRHRKKQKKDDLESLYLKDPNSNRNLNAPIMQSAPPSSMSMRFTPQEFCRKETDKTQGMRIAPIVPRAPPNSTFGSGTTGGGGSGGSGGGGGYVPPEFRSHTRHHEEEFVAREALPRPVAAEDGAVIQQFLVMHPSNDAMEASSSGTGDNYNPPPTVQQATNGPEQLSQLLQTSGMQHEVRRTSHEAIGNGVNGMESTESNVDLAAFLQRLISQQSMTPTSQDVLLRLGVAPQQGQSNGLHCSIESLPSQCKAAISEEEKIRQVANNNFPNHEMHHSFEGGALEQRKQRLSGSPKLNQEENERSNILIHDQSARMQHMPNGVDQQNHPYSQGQSNCPIYSRFPDGYILVPVRNPGNKGTNDTAKESN